MSFVEILGIFGTVATLLGAIIAYYLLRSQLPPGIEKKFIGGTVGIIVVILIISLLLSRMTGAAASGPSATPSNSNNSTPVSNIPTATQAQLTPTSPPQVQLTPTPTPSSQPKPGDILYAAGQSNGWAGWGGTSDWKVSGNMLINDGTLTDLGNNISPTITAPFQIEGTADYAIEARIQVISYRNAGIAACFGLTVRGTPAASGWQGYQGIDGCISPCCGHDLNVVSIDEQVQAPFDPGNDWHVYRMEVQGDVIRFFIDGGLKLTLTDNKYLTGGQVGLFDAEVQLNVSSFVIISL